MYDWMSKQLGQGIHRDIYALLYSLCKANGGSYKCSFAYIMERISCTEFECRYNIKKLIKAGYLERINNSAGGRGCVSEYICKKGCEQSNPLQVKKGENNLTLKGCEKSNPYKYNINNNNKVIEKENNIKESAAINRSTAPTTQPRFIKPTIEQVKVYITAKGYSVDAEHFYNYYESQGWRVGRNPMKNWQAAVRTWEAKDKQQQYGKHRTNSTIANAVEAAKLGIALADAQRAAGY